MIPPSKKPQTSLTTSLGRTISPCYHLNSDNTLSALNYSITGAPDETCTYSLLRFATPRRVQLPSRRLAPTAISLNTLVYLLFLITVFVCFEYNITTFAKNQVLFYKCVSNSIYNVRLISPLYIIVVFFLTMKSRYVMVWICIRVRSRDYLYITSIYSI